MMSRQYTEHSGDDRECTEHAEPSWRERQRCQRDRRRESDDQRGDDEVRQPFERDGRRCLTRVDRVGEQHHLQRFTGNSPEGQVTERFRRKADSRKVGEADRVPIRKARRPGPCSGQMPQPAERKRDREGEPQSAQCRRRRSGDVHVRKGRNEQDEAQSERCPPDRGRAHGCSASCASAHSAASRSAIVSMSYQCERPNRLPASGHPLPGGECLRSSSYRHPPAREPVPRTASARTRIFRCEYQPRPPFQSCAG